MKASRALENTSNLLALLTLPEDDEGKDDLEESFNLGGFPALDVGRPKVSKNQVSGESVMKKVDPSKGAVNNNVRSGAGHTVKPAAITSEHAHRLDLPS